MLELLFGVYKHYINNGFGIITRKISPLNALGKKKRVQDYINYLQRSVSEMGSLDVENKMNSIIF